MVVAAESDVYEYWQHSPNAHDHSSERRGSVEYFDEVERKRYRLEPAIPGFAQFNRWAGKRVLEIGVGLGTDFVNFARAGAVVTGIDLTDAAIDLTAQRLAHEGLSADLRVASGEQMPFEDGTFDLVYSFGVIHHAAVPERIVAEVRRVLRPGGEARIMMYGRHSPVALKVWALSQAVAIKHRRRVPRTLRQAIAECMESPGTRAYTVTELEIMFHAAGFDDVRVEGLPNPWDRRVAGPLALYGKHSWMLGVIAS